MQYNTIPYNTIQYNTIQYNTIQYNTIQYNRTTVDALLYCPPPLKVQKCTRPYDRSSMARINCGLCRLTCTCSRFLQSNKLPGWILEPVLSYITNRLSRPPVVDEQQYTDYKIQAKLFRRVLKSQRSDNWSNAQWLHHRANLYSASPWGLVGTH